MKSRYLRIMALTFTLLVVVSVSAFPQKLSIIPNVGFSKDVRTLTSNRWNVGFNLGADVFWNVTPIIGVGLRAAYHNWSADAEGWGEDSFNAGYYTSFRMGDVSGSQSVFEIMPAARFAFTASDAPVKVFAQVGVGVVIASESDVTMNAFYTTPYSTVSDRRTQAGSTLVGSGVHVGLPVMISNLIEIQPKGTFYLANADPYFHFGLNVGVRLGK
jgi:hypothetical protein